MHQNTEPEMHIGLNERLNEDKTMLTKLRISKESADRAVLIYLKPIENT